MAEIKNILASRYASAALKEIWSEEGRILLEREFWIAVMSAQRELGIEIPAEAIQAYEKVKPHIDLERIRGREKRLRHDVKARIEEFCELAGYQHVHKGMTSRDLTDNCEQFQVMKSLKVIRLKALKALSLFAEHAVEARDLVIPARTHNVPAQPTTLGKRFAMFGEELMTALESLCGWIERYPLRGIKGAAGTLLDMKTLLKDDRAKLRTFENRVAEHLGFGRMLHNVGQVYPRSLDFETGALLYRLSSPAAGFCKTLRLMAGRGEVTEGFQKGQVGSSAMPHKMNARNCERLCGLHAVLGGHVAMLERISGDQWNEGDVSCSVVRRVALPDMFFAMDGILETLLTILLEMKIFREVVEADTQNTLPFLLSTTLLMEAVRKGAGREEAHALIKQHSHAVLEDLRSGRTRENDLFARLAADERFPLDPAAVEAIRNHPDRFLGEAAFQVDAFAQEVDTLLNRFPECRDIRPGSLL